MMPPERGERDRFDEELQQHVARHGADREARTDLARPLRHRHEHDVHDADTADDQASPQRRHRAAP